MATIKDVAREAGVSISTVSRVINNKGPISDALRQSVLAAMARLDYHPNEMARALHRSRTNIIGLVVLRADFPFFSRLIQAVETSCSANGQKLMLCTSAGDFSRENSIFHILRSNKVDGVILAGWAEDNPSLQDVRIPIVTIDREIDPSVPMVACNNSEGGRIAARTLIEGGCRHPVSLISTGAISPPVVQRLDGFDDECERLGVKVRRVELPSSASRLNQDGIAFLRRMFAAHPETDGLFCIDDVATFCRFACMQLGIKTPDQVQIVGFDGLVSSATFGITTIAQPIEEMGALAFELLSRRIAGEIVPSLSVLPVQLLRRESTRSATKL